MTTLFRLGTGHTAGELFLKVAKAYNEMFLQSMESPEALAEAWPKLPGVLEHRRRMARIYAENLEGGPWELLNGWQESHVCWRYSFLTDNPEKTVPLSEALRAEGFHVSNLYWPLNHFFAPGDNCPDAESFARRIVNLWVDPSVDSDYVLGCCRNIHDLYHLI